MSGSQKPNKTLGKPIAESQKPIKALARPKKTKIKPKKALKNCNKPKKPKKNNLLYHMLSTSMLKFLFVCVYCSFLKPFLVFFCFIGFPKVLQTFC